MGRLKYLKLNSATLVETIVSMVIIVALTGITTMVFVQVTSSGYNIYKGRAQGILEKSILLTSQPQLFTNEEYEESGFIVRKEILPHLYNEKIVWLKVSIFSKEKKLLTSKNVFLLQP